MNVREGAVGMTEMYFKSIGFVGTDTILRKLAMMRQKKAYVILHKKQYPEKCDC